MRHQGIARIDKRTKDLTKRLGPEDVAIIDHVDMDRVSAEGLIETGVEVVVNAAPSISGAYPNVGPLLLTRAGVTLIDDVGPAVFERLREGDTVEVVGDDILQGRSAHRARHAAVHARTSRRRWRRRRPASATSSTGSRATRIEYLERDQSLLTDDMWVPETTTSLHGRHVLVVVRGYDFKADLAGAQALHPRDAPGPHRRRRRRRRDHRGGLHARHHRRRHGLGERRGAQERRAAHRARVPRRARSGHGATRASSGSTAPSWPLAATSEDLALLLAWESGADLIVAVGTHANLVEYLDKGRKGMASTFLVRLKVGPKLVDAKGVNKLYRASIGPMQLHAASCSRPRRRHGRAADLPVRPLVHRAGRAACPGLVRGLVCSRL